MSGQECTLSRGKLSGGNLSFLDACLPGELVRGEFVRYTYKILAFQGNLSGGKLSKLELFHRSTCPGGNCPGVKLSGGNLSASRKSFNTVLSLN